MLIGLNMKIEIGHHHELNSPEERKRRLELTSLVISSIKNEDKWKKLIDRTILFGSIVRNEDGPQSDVDVIFITSHKFPPGGHINRSIELVNDVREASRQIGLNFKIHPTLLHEDWLTEYRYLDSVTREVIESSIREGLNFD